MANITETATLGGQISDEVFCTFGYELYDRLIVAASQIEPGFQERYGTVEEAIALLLGKWEQRSGNQLSWQDKLVMNLTDGGVFSGEEV